MEIEKGCIYFYIQPYFTPINILKVHYSTGFRSALSPTPTESALILSVDEESTELSTLGVTNESLVTVSVDPPQEIKNITAVIAIIAFFIYFIFVYLKVN
jgi:hypothetical protein